MFRKYKQHSGHHKKIVIDIEDVQWTLVDECGDGKVLSGGVVGEQVVRR